ncbi:hypothetical protein SNOG_12142 [Parastagonospora nodorum SN15]|uniref:Uncharacterized protein n=1 Tax=Phaeosphaeria nodorum (strain SN15 / ATCC MYA-4574 / FGSC 10173) TaxID=321614 RepID=Q0U7X2_PHANO|nr:hypothetical protein SNOG_12142 [Parastagonospora nodorum SN15]EAT80554.1 hypothetical protein SNOG_12142 [Parastagonospora nodorum SN15]
MKGYVTICATSAKRTEQKRPVVMVQIVTRKRLAFMPGSWSVNQHA